MAEKEIPLRLNIRRDGSVALLNSNGSGSAADREFPQNHYFGFEWIAGAGRNVVEIDNDSLTIKLVNAVGSYEVVERGPNGLECKLVATELVDAPPVDEQKAQQISGRSGGSVGVTSGSVANGGSSKVEA